MHRLVIPSLFSLAVILMALPSEGRAGQGSCVIQSLKKTISEVRADFLTAADTRKINELFANTALTSQQKARGAFEVVLEARLRSVPAADAQTIRSAFQRIKASYSKSRVNGYYIASGKGRLNVTLPKAYEGSVVEYLILGHELEHALQHLRQKSVQGGFSRIIQSVKDRFVVQPTYLREEGAMVAEWRYLHALPDPVRQQLVAELKQDRILDAGSRDFLLRNLLGASKDADGYLKVQRASGRYSKTDIALHVALPAYGTAGAVSVLPLGLSASVVLGVCLSEIEKGSDFVHTKFFSQVCLHFKVAAQKTTEACQAGRIACSR